MITRVSSIRRITMAFASTSSNKTYLRIGSVRVPRREAKNPDFVPAYYGIQNQPPSNFLPHLKWLIQKDLLKQDVFLLGVPGKSRLELVLRYLEATNREFEYLSITRDTTEADIKQRREIRDGTAFYTDLCAVRAALEGRVLVIDGVERAERNVLPILNNLLENREMQLDDGRFLMKHDKYDELKKKYDEPTLKTMGLERVSENFHVIALGLPVPRFPGNTLDPPFRSRFQCRNIHEQPFQTFLEQATKIAPNVSETELNDLVSLVYAFNSEASSSRPRIASSVVEHVLGIWNNNPNFSAGEIVNICYPAKEILSESEKDLIDQFKKKFELNDRSNPRKLGASTVNGNTQNVAVEEDGKKIKLELPIASHPTTVETSWVPTKHQETLLADLAIAFSKGDFVLIGSKGSGKSRILMELSRRLNFDFVSMVLHQDMNTRELIQRRHMKENGDTVWEDSQLVKAARDGTVCVLDGVEMVHPSVLMSLSQLIFHRRFDLPNGHRLIGEKEFENILERDGLTEDELVSRGVFKIPNSFRLLLVGESQSKDHKWINENILSILPFFTVPQLSVPEQLSIISAMTDGSNTSALNKIASFVKTIKESHDSGLRNAGSCLSLRRLIHIAKRDKMQPGHLRELVEKAALSKFLPQLTKETFEHELNQAKIFNDESVRSRNDVSYIDMIRAQTNHAEEEALIPNVLFHDNKQHLEVLEDMARDMKLGSHLLLIGNQGVGKNKLTDRFLHLTNRPRQYMQLHRDTTVQTLTIQTVVENGIIRHVDSALVKAARSGQILVIDEADKAPLHVIAILKSLLDTGTLVLGDGRTMISSKNLSADDLNNEKIVPIHPGFRIIMLANRPGFPFLGNNLFAVLGDLFAIHMIDHPSRESELQMIKKYGPNVNDEILNKLLTIFNELRDKTDQGLLQYPYSTRELVNIVRHCNEFPDDPLPEVARNVFDFDSYNEDTVATIEAVFQKHGIPLGIEKIGEKVSVAEQFSLGELKNLGKWGFKRFDLTGSYGFSAPENVKISSFESIKTSNHPLEKTSTRNLEFSEQFCHWKLPVEEDNIVSDAIRVNDDLIVATVNPRKILYMRNFMETQSAEEFDLHDALKYTDAPRFRLNYLGNNKVLCFEEKTGGVFLIDLENKTISVTERNETFANQMEALFNVSQRHWRMAPPNGTSAIVYEWKGDEMFIYSPNGENVSIQSGAVPFKIKRVVPVAENQWIIVSTNDENYVLKKEKSEWIIDEMNHNLTEKFDTISTKANGSDLYMVAEPYYYLHGKHHPEEKHNVAGIVRQQPKQVVDSRRPYYLSDKFCEKSVDPSREVAYLGKNIIRARPNWEVPKNVLSKDVPISHVAGFLEAIDTEAQKVCYVPVPSPFGLNYHREWLGSISRTGFVLVPWSDDKVLTIDSKSEIRSYELTMSALSNSFNEWKRMSSGGDENLRMEFEREKDNFDMSKLDEPKLGKIDPNNTPHHGGNQWMGGTGGYNTAGLGGVGGPFRLDAGHDVHQMSDFAKQQVPEHILKKAREIAKEEYAKKLREINMSEYDANAYENVWNNVKSHTRKLSSVIDQLEAKKKEREWAKHQTNGDLDDGKLIEGVTGDQNIYRRRIDKEPDPGAPQTKPKRLKMCFDVSGSMYRFNGYDKRLQRSLETALMVMTSLDNKTEKVEYDIVGHSGDSPCVRFIDKTHYPKNNKERLDTLKRMLAHTQYCSSGDNTVECLEFAVKEMAKREDYDESVVILVSDANLERYGIRPSQLKKEMLKENTVNCFVVFIGSLGEQANHLLAELPAGKAFVLKDAEELPKIMETIFASTIAQ